jgi:uncharacterized protein (TIGR02147 family)
MSRRDREYPSVHDYDDYRAYIVDWLKVWGLPRANFARQAGLSNKGRLTNILNGRDRLSRDSLPGVARALALHDHEVEGLSLRVELEEELRALANAGGRLAEATSRLAVADRSGGAVIGARRREQAARASLDERERAVAELQRRISALRLMQRAESIEALGMLAVSSWIYPAVAEHARCVGFDPDPEAISRAFGGALTPAQATDALELLTRLGVLKPDGDGRFTVGDLPRLTREAVPAAAVRNLYLGLHERSGAALRRIFDDEDAEFRARCRLGALTIALPDADEARALLLEFQQRALLLLESRRERPPTQVLQLVVQIFPLTEPTSADMATQTPAEATADTGADAHPHKVGESE